MQLSLLLTKMICNLRDHTKLEREKNKLNVECDSTFTHANFPYKDPNACVHVHASRIDV